DYFASAVSVSGDTIVVGAYASGAQQGAAYVFVRTGGTWSQQAKLTTTPVGPHDVFGLAVAVSGDLAIIGADTSGVFPGTAYAFQRTGGAWAQTQTFSGTQPSDSFGYGVALDGTTAIIGANSGGSIGQGSAYIFWSLPLGTACSDAAPCSSGFCVDGVCC